MLDFGTKLIFVVVVVVAVIFITGVVGFKICQMRRTPMVSVTLSDPPVITTSVKNIVV